MYTAITNQTIADFYIIFITKEYDTANTKVLYLYWVMNVLRILYHGLFSPTHESAITDIMNRVRAGAS
jgi:hypothetical protein